MRVGRSRPGGTGATMALMSMTGFADRAGSCGGVSWAWEARSVNGRGLDLRVRLELYAGVRPVRAIPGIPLPLADPRARDIDLVVVRESTEGLFASRGKGVIEDDREARGGLSYEAFTEKWRVGTPEVVKRFQ